MSTRLIRAHVRAALASTLRLRRFHARRPRRLAMLAALSLLLATAPVLATFHLMKIVEVYTGSTAAPNAQYVVLQMYASGQNLVGGHPVTVYNAGGTQIAQFVFNGNVPNGANQARILIATQEAQTFFGIQADLTMTAAMMRAGAKVCFDTIDCVAWGAYTGPSAGVGTPFNAAGGIPLGRAMSRRLDISGSPTALENGDDTNSCANDFVSAFPTPRNNAGATGVPPAATCGNGTVEALEQCDDGNTNSGDGCSSTCAIDTPVANLSVGNVSVSEGNSGTRTANFVVSLSQASPSPVRYNIATANGTATAGSDYVARSLANETIPAGQTSRAFAVTINGDLVREADETFRANATSVRGAGVTDAQGQGTIVNDDNPMLSIGDISVSEGNSGGKLFTFTVRLSQASNTPVPYTVSTSNGSATSGSDYVGRVLNDTMPAGATSRGFNVVVNGDTTREANETFIATLSAATVSIADGTASATIVNDDGPTLSINDVFITEGNSSAKLVTFTVRLSQASATPVPYQVATSNGTATSGSDYVGRVLNDTMPAGATSRGFNVIVNGDTTREANETFNAVLVTASGATIFDNVGRATILNDDGPTMTISDVSISEGNSGGKLATFTIRLSQASTSPVSYRVATTNGSAIAGSDYVGRVLDDAIPAGSISRGFNVIINGDTAVEPNESFTATLVTASGATILDGVGRATLLNDDGPTLTIGNTATLEGNSLSHLVAFPVTLSQASANPVSYTVATSDATAVAGTDYVARRLVNEVIPAGQTARPFQVTILGDTAVEPHKVFLASLSAASGATIFDSVGTAEIVNDDVP